MLVEFNLEVLARFRLCVCVAAGLFCVSAWTGDATAIARLLRGNGHLVAALDADGRTALLRSCVGGHLEVVRVLVEAGADVSYRWRLPSRFVCQM